MKTYKKIQGSPADRFIVRIDVYERVRQVIWAPVQKVLIQQGRRKMVGVQGHLLLYEDKE